MNSLEEAIWQLIVMSGYVAAIIACVYLAHLTCKALDVLTYRLRHRK